MAISKTTPQIGLRLVGMADGSTGVVTDRGEILYGQTSTSLRSSPGGETIVTVEFIVDHDKFRIEKPEA